MTLQPDPKRGVDLITPAARKDFDDRLSLRFAQGMKTYGTPLMTFNGRDAHEDILDELIDAYQYTVQAKKEAKRLEVYRDLLYQAYLLLIIAVEDGVNDVVKENFPIVDAKITSIIASITSSEPASRTAVPSEPLESS